MALIAMLALAEEGERSRAWLQDRLWGAREAAQGRASLRRELSSLRRRLNGQGAPLVSADRDRVSLDLARMEVDARAPAADAGELLEGLDLAGAEEFEEWLREARAKLAEQRGDRRGPAPLPSRIVDLTTPAPGFGGRPALAVLAFANRTGEDSADYLAEGLSEDLIERLSRLRWLPVIARSSSFTIAAADPREAGRSLGARYVLSGALRRVGDAFGLSVTLTDAETGQVMFARRLELPRPDRAAPERLATELTAVLDTRIDRAEQVRAHALRTQAPQEAAELVWRGRWRLNRFTRADSDRARELFAEALAIAPDWPEALIQATFCLAWTIWAQRRSDGEIRYMRELAQRAINADPEDSRGHMLAGIAEMWLRRPGQAKILLGQAITLNPSLAFAHAQLGGTCNLEGDGERAVAPLLTSLRLSPNDQNAFYSLAELGVAHTLMRSWRAAIDHADQALIRRPAYWYAHVIKINALARLGEGPAASEALDELMRVRPSFQDSYLDWVPFMDGRWTEHLKEGLARARR